MKPYLIVAISILKSPSLCQDESCDGDDDQWVLHTGLLADTILSRFHYSVGLLDLTALEQRVVNYRTLLNR